MCLALYQREEGFFVGALSINVVTTELVTLVLFYFCLLVLDTGERLMFTIVFAAALLFPAAFYHHSWSFWLSLDHLLEKLPKHTPDGRGKEGPP